MDDILYVAYAKEQLDDVRMLLNPLLMSPLYNSNEFYNIIKERHPTLIDSDLIFSSLYDAPVIIDIDQDGNIVFLYVENRAEISQYSHILGDQVMITADPTLKYIRSEDFDRLLSLRNDFLRN